MGKDTAQAEGVVVCVAVAVVVVVVVAVVAGAAALNSDLLNNQICCSS
jgi:hypothetical protein